MPKKKAIINWSKALDRKDYSKIFEQLKTDIQQTQLRAALTITKELILLYWRTGKILSNPSSLTFSSKSL